ncbi:hypothetical protein [Rhodococcoides fascians]|uniref:hypothetical protein n=1 Tax=Rhodococcoides fascians TaxID=1828 RepID=UPI000569A3A8|nr:hypothetical protein [Rhodococcus fascians]
MPIHSDHEAAVKYINDETSPYSPAGELNYDNLGDRIEFYWKYPNGVLAHVAGVLQKVTHSTAWTTIAISGYPYSPTSGPGLSGEFEEFNLDDQDPVEVFDER